MNHFMARLIFCFFAEDTDIFGGTDLFTGTVEQMSAGNSANTHEVIGEIFRAMNTEPEARKDANIPRWADPLPYVNGGLFSKSTDVPRFSRIARSYLLHIGNLDWKKINPDIFGSMIQAVADEEERGALGMHYTSVPNILKVLNPLFLDDLREKLEEGRQQFPEAAQPAQPHGTGPGVRPSLWVRQLPGHRLQGNARDRSADQREETRGKAEVGHPPDQLQGNRATRLPSRDRPPCPHHRGISVRRAPSRAKGGAGGVPAARCDELDYLRQCPFTFELHFSPTPRHVSYRTVQGSLFTIGNGRITKASRMVKRQHGAWSVTVQPSGTDDISIRLNPTPDCEAKGAICTPEGGALMTGLTRTVQGPAGNLDRRRIGGRGRRRHPRLRGGAEPDCFWQTTRVDYATSDGSSERGPRL